MTNRKAWLAPAPETERKQGILPIEWLALGWGAFTAVLTVLLWERMEAPGTLLVDRLLIATGTMVLWGVYTCWPSRVMLFLRITAQMVLLSYWYPDTYTFNCLFPNLDHLFAGLEQQLFGGQPALTFSRLLPDMLFSEAFNLGYYAYYPMIIVVMVFYFLKRFARYEEASFVVMASFFIYYAIYIFVPVTGPQFYFQAIGTEAAEAGHFTELGTYFSEHTEMLPAPGDADGVFYKLVQGAQDAGERPTAAFPSSHIGISTILLLLAFPVSRRLGWALTPFFVLLCGATVYIQAHYVIDTIAGLLSAVPVFLAATALYRYGFARKRG